jgi:hypothetical protein
MKAFPVLITAVFAASCVVSGASAQDTVRVRGEIAKVDGATLSVKARDGASLTVKLAEPPRIAAMEKATLDDIKQGSFIGVSAMPQADGSQKAYAIHIFMDSQKGVVPDRFLLWDSRPGSTMTNAVVGTTVAGKDGRELLVKYKDGEKKIIVPPDVPIVRYVISNAAELKPGARFTVIAATAKPDGSYEAARINVGRDGVVPQ